MLILKDSFSPIYDPTTISRLLAPGNFNLWPVMLCQQFLKQMQKETEHKPVYLSRTHHEFQIEKNMKKHPEKDLRPPHARPAAAAYPETRQTRNWSFRLSCPSFQDTQLNQDKKETKKQKRIEKVTILYNLFVKNVCYCSVKLYNLSVSVLDFVSLTTSSHVKSNRFYKFVKRRAFTSDCQASGTTWNLSAVSTVISVVICAVFD